MKKVLISFVCSLFLTAAAFAQSNSSPWKLELNLGGATSGGAKTIANGKSVTDLGGTIGLSHETHILLPADVGARQSFNYQQETGKAAKDSVTCGTEVFYDVNVPIGSRLELYAGPSARVAYCNTPLAFSAGPEAGFRLYLNKDKNVAFVTRVNYDFKLSTGPHDDAKDGIRYNGGLMFRF